MKKIVLVIAIGSFALTSCGGAKKAADINVADINDACGCLDNMNIVAAEVVSLIEPFETENELEADEAALKNLESLEDKFKEIEDRCRKGLELDKSELEACDGFKDFESKMETIENKL